jgi:hypothetical protein
MFMPVFIFSLYSHCLTHGEVQLTTLPIMSLYTSFFVNIWYAIIIIIIIIIMIKVHRTTILPVVLYGCETWTVTLREERRLSVLDNMVLRRIFGRKRDEVIGE